MTSFTLIMEVSNIRVKAFLCNVHLYPMHLCQKVYLPDTFFLSDAPSAQLFTGKFSILPFLCLLLTEIIFWT